MDQSISLKYRSVSYASIFSLEAMAILESIIQASRLQVSKVTIFSDLKSVLTSLQNINLKNNTSHLIFKIKHGTSLFVKNGISVKLIWIPSHCGILGNERVDLLAKNATRSGCDYQQYISLNDFRTSSKTKQFEKFFDWCKRLSNEKASWYFNNCFIPSRHPWYNLYDISRKTIVSICRIRSGHTSLKTSLARLIIVPSSNCPVCDTPESLDHIFWECKRFTTQREQFNKYCIKSINTFPFPVKSLVIDLGDENIVFVLNQFITSINYNI